MDQTPAASNKFDKVMMSTASLWAKQSKCKRLQVGAVLAKEGRILCIGYNGTISGAPNKCEDENNKTIEEVVHAEQNLISFAAKEGIAMRGCTIYITHSPCIMCAKLLIQSGVDRVVYGTEYRDLTGVEFLRKHNKEVIHYD